MPAMCLSGGLAFENGGLCLNLIFTLRQLGLSTAAEFVVGGAVKYFVTKCLSFW